MHTASLNWNSSKGWQPQMDREFPADLILYLGNRESLANGARYDELRAMFPDAHLMGCSTGGQISEGGMNDEINAIALHFDVTGIRVGVEHIDGAGDSRRHGEEIGRKLASNDLAGVFVLSDGLNVNGSELVAGLNMHVGDVPLVGGLACDGALFTETLVGLDSPPRSRTIAAIGFYGAGVRIGHGSAGGWDVFGPKRRVTSSTGNVLRELDGQSALELYERYLSGNEVKALPGSALLFPLRIYDPKRPDHQVARTVRSVDRDKRSMTFAGDIPEGWVAQLTRGNLEHLAMGAADAARQARDGVDTCRDNEGVAILVSCIGRKLRMGQRVQDEVDAAGRNLGPNMRQTGFYSYGEISPHALSGICELHNQTMMNTSITQEVA